MPNQRITCIIIIINNRKSKNNSLMRMLLAAKLMLHQKASLLNRSTFHCIFQNYYLILYFKIVFNYPMIINFKDLIRIVTLQKEFLKF